jgi:hypothetical protein
MGRGKTPENTLKMFVLKRTQGRVQLKHGSPCSTSPNRPTNISEYQQPSSFSLLTFFKAENYNNRTYFSTAFVDYPKEPSIF